MQPDKRWCLPFFLLFVSLLAACSGTAAPEATGPTPSATATAEYYDTAMPTHTPRPPSTPKPTEEPTATPEATPSDDTEVEIERISVLDRVDLINSYRFSIEVQVAGDAFEGTDAADIAGRNVVIEGVVVKEPPAQEFTISFTDADTSSGFRVVDGQTYVSLNGEWFEGDSADAPNLEELLALTSADITPYLDTLDMVGDEDVDGRAAVHYHANQAALVALTEAQDRATAEIYAQATEAGADIWVDEEGGFVSKMDVVVSGTGVNADAPDLEGQYQVHVEYFDINADLAVEVPELSDEAAASSGGGGSDPGEMETTNQNLDDLTDLLGFRIPLPDGSKVEIFFDLASITVPLPIDDTRPIFIRAFESNDYVRNTDSTVNDFGVFLYDNGEKQWTLFFTEQDSTSTLVSISPVVEGTPTPQ